MRLFRSLLAPLVLLCLLALTAAGPLQETPPPSGGESRALISSPAEGSTIAGVVTITGTVTDPDFRSYQLEYAPDPTLASIPWTPVQGTVSQQVPGGILGAWDTTNVADGRYIIRLRVNRHSGAALDYEVRVQVVNATPTATYMPVTRTPTPLPGTATPGPSPTPLIEQPPTRTPRPAAAFLATSTPIPALTDGSPLQPDRLMRAARRGAIVALVIFGALGVYAVIRAASRGDLGEGVWRFRREVIHPLLDSQHRKKDH